MIMQQQNVQKNESSYWVVGGVYASTEFNRIAGSAPQEERFGPYHSYAEAFSEWSRLAWKTVDDAHARYRIVRG